jgi:hypothetical protein
VEGLPASGAPVARSGRRRGCSLAGEGGSVGRETRQRATTSAREGEGRTTRLATGLRPGLVATGARRYRRPHGRPWGGLCAGKKQRHLYGGMREPRTGRDSAGMCQDGRAARAGRKDVRRRALRGSGRRGSADSAAFSAFEASEGEP